jgi:hypothetical protein
MGFLLIYNVLRMLTVQAVSILLEAACKRFGGNIKNENHVTKQFKKQRGYTRT